MTNPEQSLTRATHISNIILAAGSAASVLVFFYYFYYYSWTGARQFSNRIGILLYYVLPVGLAFLLFASLRLPRGHKINLAILCVSLTASLYGAESFLLFIDPTVNRPVKPLMAVIDGLPRGEKERAATKIAKQFGVPVDSRSGLEVLTDLQKGGIDAVPIITPSKHLFIRQPDGSVKSAISINGEEVMPLGGISGKTTLLCNESGQWIHYPSDEHGFNNPKGSWQIRQMDIAAVGDSYAHGYCVPPNKGFVALIQQRYPATLNLGMAGNGPLLTLATVSEYLTVFKPKVVLWFYFEGNDIPDVQTEKESRLLMRYLKEGFNQSLIVRQNDVDRALLADIKRQMVLGEIARARWKANYRGNLRDKLLDFVKLSALRTKLALVEGTTSEAVKNLADLEGPTTNLFDEILSQAKARVGAWRGQLYFVYLPYWGRYGLKSLGPGANQREQVLNYVRSLGISIIDIHPVFQAQGDPLSLFPFREDGHYNEQGHRLVAEKVLNSISGLTAK